MKCAKIPPWVKNPIGGRIVGANDARLPIPWQVLITNALKGEKKRSDFSIESTKSPCINAPSDLQPHYCNGVFGSVYLLALDNTKR